MVRLWRWFQHARLRNDLSAYIDGRLGAAPARRLEAHLAACEQCRRQLAELQATVNALRWLPQAAVPRSFVLSPQRARRPAPALPFYTPVRAAAVAAAVALAALLTADLASIGGMPSGEMEAPVQLAAPTPAAAPAATPAPAAAEGMRESEPVEELEATAAMDAAAPEAEAEGGPAVVPAPRPTG
ncbi:MAG: anti-sigma factor family protein, partial [Dehalococcoidia bacterium]